MHELGTGVLRWAQREQFSSRYGSVYLVDQEENWVNFGDTDPLRGKVGKLVAVVREVGESTHIGDMTLGTAPESPVSVGEEIELGEGRFFTSDRDYFVGVQPLDGREKQWLDSSEFLRVYHQKVTLYFEPIETT